MTDTNPTPSSATFETELSSFGNNTGIVVPPDVIAQLGAGRRPPVDVEVNGYRYRTTVGVMNGQHLVSVSAAVRKETGLTGGDPITVTLALNTTTREVEVPNDLADALRREPTAFEFFGALSNSLQRYHVDQITGAKTPATRQRRVDKAVALFLAGKKR
jgi:antitoxin component of MazEF toxin-antitoxin module